ncbi:MAG: RNA polymerase sigma factor [Sciscionella sp.]
MRAFELLVSRFQRRIYALAVRMLGSAAEAEDVVQDVFITAWRRLPDIREDAAFVGWLYKTATNRCLALLRKRRPQVELDTERHASGLVEHDPERSVEVSGQLDALAEALQHLPAQQRACWLLREAHGRSYEEIASLVGASPDAVRGRIARARVELARMMRSWH